LSNQFILKQGVTVMGQKSTACCGVLQMPESITSLALLHYRQASNKIITV